MNGFNFLAILRTITYLWAAIEFSNLTYLYAVGYKNVRTTPIIRTLQIMFLSVSLLFFALAFLPIILELSSKTHYIVVAFLPILIIPVAITARNFRTESLQKQTMILPDRRKDK